MPFCPFDKNCKVLFYTVYLNSLLLLLVNHVPHLKQCSKCIPIKGIQRPKRLRIYFIRSAEDSVSYRVARSRSSAKPEGVQRTKSLTRLHELAHCKTQRSAEDSVLCRGAGCPRSKPLLAAAGGARKKVVTICVNHTTTKDTKLPPIILLILSLVIFACAFAYTIYRREADKRTIGKKRNQYNDRV